MNKKLRGCPGSKGHKMTSLGWFLRNLINHFSSRLKAKVAEAIKVHSFVCDHKCRHSVQSMKSFLSFFYGLPIFLVTSHDAKTITNFLRRSKTSKESQSNDKEQKKRAKVTRLDFFVLLIVTVGPCRHPLAPRSPRPDQPPPTSTSFPAEAAAE